MADCPGLSAAAMLGNQQEVNLQKVKSVSE